MDHRKAYIEERDRFRMRVKEAQQTMIRFGVDLESEPVEIKIVVDAPVEWTPFPGKEETASWKRSDGKTEGSLASIVLRWNKMTRLGKHFHPASVEKITVHEGKISVYKFCGLEVEEIKLKAGESIVIAAAVVHDGFCFEDALITCEWMPPLSEKPDQIAEHSSMP